MDNSIPLENKSNRLAIVAIILVSVVALYIMYAYLPTGVDWFGIRSGVLSMLSGNTPYITNIFNPPWIYVLLIPFAILPFKISFALLSFTSLAVIVLVAYRLGKSPIAIAAIIITPAVIRQIVDPNLEFLVALGFILPPQIGLFFIMAKPQLGLPVAIYWTFDTYRKGGVRLLIKVFSPVVIVTLLSFVLFGLWPLEALRLQGSSHNISMWPTSIPFGLALLVYAIRRRRQNLSLLSAPFLAPYYGFYSLHIPLLGLPGGAWETIAASVGMWIMFLL